MPIHEIRLEAFDPEQDSQRLRDWLRRPHVTRWWGDHSQQFENPQWRSRETHAVIVADGAPVGYLCWPLSNSDQLVS